MNFELKPATSSLARAAVAVATALAAISAQAGPITFTSTSPDFIGSGQPPATQTVGSFSFTGGQLNQAEFGTITQITVSGIFGGGTYQNAVGNYYTAPTDLMLDGVKIATCGPYDVCSNGYNPIYDGLQTFSYTFTKAQYAGLLSLLSTGPALLTAVLDSPYSQNYPNDLTGLKLAITATVPEPEVDALLLGGLGLVAFASRRSRRKAAPAFA